MPSSMESDGGSLMRMLAGDAERVSTPFLSPLSPVFLSSPLLHCLIPSTIHCPSSPFIAFTFPSLHRFHRHTLNFHNTLFAFLGFPSRHTLLLSTCLILIFFSCASHFPYCWSSISIHQLPTHIRIRITVNFSPSSPLLNSLDHMGVF